MKNQYVGDIGDYGKYGLLRFLAKKGIRIGVNWYLTEDDSPEKNNDGKHIRYLQDEKAESKYDSEVFDLLKRLVDEKKRDVLQIESSSIIQNAIYYNEKVKKGAERNAWHQDAMNALSEAELVFADPDNGTFSENEKKPANAEKYASLEELKQYYSQGQNIVYYCQRGRRNAVDWKKKTEEFAKQCPGAKIIVLIFRRGTQRAYIFCVHPEKYEFYDAAIRAFMQTNWGTLRVNGRNIPFMR